jgi:anhydro-N-acetylmuramic acid kinase
MKVAGVISGTSLDAIDVAILEFEQDFKVIGHHSVPYPPGVRDAILAISNTETHTASIARLNFLLGELFADAVVQACHKIGIPLAALNLIGSHGQTIFHEGEPVDMFGYSIASTMQIGEPAVIAKRTGVPTIADFRPDDMAAGGKGAPLVPAVDFRLFRHPEKSRIALNIGGIANMTFLPANARIEDVVAFDIGPGNMVIDALMGEARMDRDGSAAREGQVEAALLEKLLSDPFYDKAPPKTAGREQYGIGFVSHFSALNWKDAAATATELTVQTIAHAVARYPEAVEVIVSGGGAHNGFMMERLRSVLTPDVKTSADYGIDIDAKEAIAFAILAYESFHGRPGNVPGATGARRQVILGKSVMP